MCVDLTDHDRPSVIWCNLNAEGDLLEKMIPGSRQVAGRHSIDEKESILSEFTNGNLKTLITKPKIGGFGLNWQHCNRTVIFPTHSWEAWYQMIRRFWRFGQKKTVRVDAVLSESETRILQNLRRKESDAQEMIRGMVSAMSEMTTANLQGTVRNVTDYEANQTMELPEWLK
jgi:SNF2 family DNA or RNA helicase